MKVLALTWVLFVGAFSSACSTVNPIKPYRWVESHTDWKPNAHAGLNEKVWNLTLPKIAKLNPKLAPCWTRSETSSSRSSQTRYEILVEFLEADPSQAKILKVLEKPSETASEKTKDSHICTLKASSTVFEENYLRQRVSLTYRWKENGELVHYPIQMAVASPMDRFLNEDVFFKLDACLPSEALGWKAKDTVSYIFSFQLVPVQKPGSKSLVMVISKLEGQYPTLESTSCALKTLSEGLILSDPNWSTEATYDVTYEVSGTWTEHMSRLFQVQRH